MVPRCASKCLRPNALGVRLLRRDPRITATHLDGVTRYLTRRHRGPPGYYLAAFLSTCGVCAPCVSSVGRNPLYPIYLRLRHYPDDPLLPRPRGSSTGLRVFHHVSLFFASNHLLEMWAHRMTGSAWLRVGSCVPARTFQMRNIDPSMDLIIGSPPSSSNEECGG